MLRGLVDGFERKADGHHQGKPEPGGQGAVEVKARRTPPSARQADRTEPRATEAHSRPPALARGRGPGRRAGRGPRTGPAPS